MIHPNNFPPVPASGHLRVAHTADNHLRQSCGGSTARGRDFLRATLDVVNKASQWNADVLIAAGDLIDKSEIQAAVAGDVKAVLDRANELGLRLLTTQGNHDMTNGRSWPEILGGTAQVLDHKMVEVRGLRILGLPFLPPDAMRAELAILRENQPPDVLVWHGPIAELAGYDSGTCLKLADFENLGTAAVLLGDIHARVYVDVPGSGMLGYPGATEMCKKDEPLEHSFTLIDFARNSAGRWEVHSMCYIPVDSRPTKVLRIYDADGLAREVNNVTEWRSTLHRPPQLFVKFASCVPDVRARLTAAAGADSIVRAESFDLAVEAVTVEAASGESALPSIQDYVRSKLPGEWEQKLASRLLSMEPGSDYSGVLKNAIDEILIA